MIRAGYLADIRGVRVGLEQVKLDEVEQSGGDFDANALGEVLEQASAPLHVLTAYRQHATGRKAIVFVPTVALAHRMATVFREAGIRAEALDGNTPWEQRRAILTRLHTGETRVVANVAVLCLDADTEILTSRGWATMDDISPQDRVANWWPDGSITWELPKEIISRARRPGERMVFLETRNRSIRVTEGHRLLHRADARFAWTKSAARDLVGRSRQLPVSGRSDPMPVSLGQSQELDERRLRRLVSASAYKLRRHGAYGWDDSFVEAERRVRHRQGLRAKMPAELTLVECWLIGFWIGDGSVNRLRRGGVEYRMSQSLTYPRIVAMVDAKLAQVDLHVIRRVTRARGNAREAVIWSLPRGTGGGSQQRAGIYPIEPYLDKNGSHLLWGLDERQFDALLEGLWFADGDHRDGTTVPETLRIHESNGRLLDLLQAIAVCRGYRAYLHQPRPIRKPDWTPMRKLVLRKEAAHRMSNRVAGSVLRFDDRVQAERVWCVRTTSGNLITRRRGTVTVVGNCEGVDVPSVDAVILATPTRSQVKYTQCLGRGLRTFPGKEDCLVIDVVGASERLDLQTLPRLFNLRDVPAPEATVTEALERARLEKTEIDRRRALERQKAEGRTAAAREGTPDGELRSRPVSMLAARRRTARRLRRLRHRECWLVSLGSTGTLALVPDGSRWRVLRLHGGKHEQLASGVDLGYAHGIAQDYVRAAGAQALAAPYARWRAKPMNGAQANLLRRLGITAPEGTTKGGASDLITVAKAARLLDRLADQAA